MDEKNNKYHYLLAAVLGVAGLLIILIFVSLRSQTTNSELPTDVTIANSAPAFATAPRIGSTDGGNEISSAQTFSITSESGSHEFYVNGNYTDDNGCWDVENHTDTASLQVVLHSTENHSGFSECYGSDTEGECISYSANDANCSFDTGSNLTTCDSAEDTSGSYQCQITVPYFAAGTDASSANPGYKWVAEVRLQDKTADSQSTVYSSTTFEMNTFTAIYVPQSEIDFGSVSAGATSSNVGIDVVNEGNDEDLDVNLSNTDLTCSVSGVIQSTDIYMRKDAQMTDSSTNDTNLPETPEKFNSDIDKDYSTAENNSSTFYFMLEVPETGRVGTCVGTTTISATA